jgi:Flp pilus assembly protein CpaB
MNETTDDMARTVSLGIAREAGRVWRVRQRAADRGMATLRLAIRQASAHGAKVTELADAAGVSRKAVYRALDGD